MPSLTALRFLTICSRALRHKLTQKKKDDLLRMMASAKASRWSLSRFIEYLQEKFDRPAYTIETDYLNEAIAFACENW